MGDHRPGGKAEPHTSRFDCARSSALPEPLDKLGAGSGRPSGNEGRPQSKGCLE